MNRLILGPMESAYEEIKAAAIRHQGGKARIAVAWAKDDGVNWLLDAINGHITDLNFVIGINERGTTVEALLRILQHNASLRIFYKHPYQTFHPKIYCFESGSGVSYSTTVIIGSSNVTIGGLITNYESSIVLQIDQGPLSQDDNNFIASVNISWETIISPPFSHVIRDVNDVQKLYETGYIVSENTIRRERRSAGKKGKPLRDLPTAPPQYVVPRVFEQITVPFALDRDIPGGGPSEDTDPQGSTPLPERFFVRTLTANDVAKLRGRPGTFEPDLGETARDQYPSFWGWSEKYKEVTRKLHRLEWQVEARLISSQTPPEGVIMSVILWFREARSGHAAEHRFSPRPIDIFKRAVPPSFDTSSLLVIEQAPVDAVYQYVIKLITAQDPEYNDFATYLVATRPHHRYGYGP